MSACLPRHRFAHSRKNHRRISSIHTEGIEGMTKPGALRQSARQQEGALDLHESTIRVLHRTRIHVCAASRCDGGDPLIELPSNAPRTDLTAGLRRRRTSGTVGRELRDQRSRASSRA